MPGEVLGRYSAIRRVERETYSLTAALMIATWGEAMSPWAGNKKHENRASRATIRGGSA